MELVRSIGEIAPQVWEIAVRQAYVNGVIAIVSAVFCLFLLTVGFMSFRWGMWKATQKEYDSDDNPLPVIAIFSGFLVTLIFPFLVYASVTDAVRLLVNPEYEAIKILLNLAGVK